MNWIPIALPLASLNTRSNGCLRSNCGAETPTTVYVIGVLS
jgi:hypothetical protein